MPRPHPAPRRARRLCLPLLPPRPPASLWPQLWCALALPFLLQTAAKPPNAAFRFPHTTASRARPSAEVARVPRARPPGFYYPFLVLQDPSHRTPPDEAPRCPSAKSGPPRRTSIATVISATSTASLLPTRLEAPPRSPGPPPLSLYCVGVWVTLMLICGLGKV